MSEISMASCRKQSHSRINRLDNVTVEDEAYTELWGPLLLSCVVSMEIVDGRSRRED